MRSRPIRAILVEDEPPSMENLRWMLERHCPYVEIMAECGNGATALKAIKRHLPDLVFLDIHLGDMSGFDVIKSIHKLDFDIIITTSDDNFMLQAIREQAIDYLKKPIKRAELQEAVERVYDKLQRQTNTSSRIGLPISTGEKYVNIVDIIYLEANNAKCKAYVMDAQGKEDCIEITRVLNTMEQLLWNYPFCRIHSKYLINLEHLKEHLKKDGGYVRMSNGKLLSIARGKRDDFSQCVANWRNGK